MYGLTYSLHHKKYSKYNVQSAFFLNSLLRASLGSENIYKIVLTFDTVICILSYQGVHCCTKVCNLWGYSDATKLLPWACSRPLFAQTQYEFFVSWHLGQSDASRERSNTAVIARYNCWAGLRAQDESSDESASHHQSLVKLSHLTNFHLNFLTASYGSVSMHHRRQLTRVVSSINYHLITLIISWRNKRFRTSDDCLGYLAWSPTLSPTNRTRSCPRPLSFTEARYLLKMRA